MKHIPMQVHATYFILDDKQCHNSLKYVNNIFPRNVLKTFTTILKYETFS